MSKKLKLALLQYSACPDKEKNFEKIKNMITEACETHKPDLIALPEMSQFRGKSELEAEMAEKIPGPSSNFFSKLAKKFEVSIMTGSILEKNPLNTTEEKHKPLNTSFYVNQEGKILSKYSKVHLFDIALENSESNTRAYGSTEKSNLPVFEDLDTKMATTICYDLRFPELYRQYMFRDQKPDIIFVPAAFSVKTGPYHWESLLRARAIENTVFIVAPNQIGKSGSGFECHGDSMIIDPWGNIIARAKTQEEEIICGEIDLELIEKYRKTLPLENVKLI